MAFFKDPVFASFFDAKKSFNANVANEIFNTNGTNETNSTNKNFSFVISYSRHSYSP